MKKITFLVGFLLLTLTGCEKEADPIASFSLSNYNPDVGEIILVTNNSIDAFSYLWNDGEGNQTDEFAPTLIYDNPGTYKVTLTAFSESGSKQNVATETVTVVQSYGDVSFWQSGTPAYGITVVSIDGKSANITADYPNGISECNMSGCANFHLKTGQHSFTASDGEYTWSGSVTIEADICKTFQLQ